MSENLLNRKNRILLREMVKTDFKLRYQGSVLGMAWSVMKPLMLFTIMYIVFVKFLRFGAGIPHFAVALLLGIVLWQFFAEAVGQGMQSVVARGDLLRKINFPKSIVVVSATFSALINLSINLVIVVIFGMINGVDFGWQILWTPLLILQLYILALGLAFLLAALYVKWRDIGHIWDVIAQGLFYATPIIYPLAMVAAFSLSAAKLLLLNPVAQIIQDARAAMIMQPYEACTENFPGVCSGTETVWNVIGSHWLQILPIVLTLAIFALGIWYFNRHAAKFAEEN